MKGYNIFFFIPLLFLLLSLHACTSKSKKDMEYVKGWHGKKISLPSESDSLLFGRDSVVYDYSSFPYKIVLVIGKEQCISCKFDVAKWQELIQQVDSITSFKVGFVFVLEPIYQHDVYVMLRSHQFMTPVFIDTNNTFRSMNKISDNDSHVWLLDSNNRIIYIGDPTVNQKINKEYMELVRTNYLFNDK